MERVISFLLGFSWALVFISALFMFSIFYSQYGYMIAIFGAIIGICFSLFFVLFLELAILQFKKYEELQKQTKLLEELKNKN